MCWAIFHRALLLLGILKRGVVEALLLASPLPRAFSPACVSASPALCLPPCVMLVLAFLRVKVVVGGRVGWESIRRRRSGKRR